MFRSLLFLPTCASQQLGTKLWSESPRFSSVDSTIWNTHKFLLAKQTNWVQPMKKRVDHPKAVIAAVSCFSVSVCFSHRHRANCRSSIRVASTATDGLSSNLIIAYNSLPIQHRIHIFRSLATTYKRSETTWKHLSPHSRASRHIFFRGLLSSSFLLIW